MDVNQEGNESSEDEETKHPSPFVDDILELEPHQTKINQGDRIKEKKVIEEGRVGNPVDKKAHVETEPVGGEDGRADKHQEEMPQAGSVTEEAEGPQDAEITGQVLDSLGSEGRHSPPF